MYYDTPRDFIGGVYEELLYGDQPLGWDIIGRKETIRSATRDTFHGYVDHWYRPVAHGRRRRRQDRRRRCTSAIAGAARRPARRRRPAAPRAGQASSRTTTRVKVHTKAVRPGAHLPRRPQLPARASGPLRPAGARDRARRRDVVTPLHRGARAPRARATTSTASTTATPTRARSTRRRASTSTASTMRSPRSPRRAAARSPTSLCPSDELEKAKSFAKGRFVLQLENVAGTDHVRPAPRGARGQDARPGGDPRGDRQGDRRGRQSRRAGRDRRNRA